MRLLFLNQYYSPDIAATAQLMTDLCEDLAAAGHSVRVLCSSGRYRLPHRGREVADEARSSETLPRRELLSGVDVHRVDAGRPSQGRGAARLIHRFWNEARFSIGLLAEIFALPPGERPDVIVTLSSPPLLLPLGWVARARLGAPLLFWVQDVYPELIFALAALRRDSLVGKLAETLLPRLWRGLYSAVDAAVALDSAMAQRLVAAGLPAARLQVIEHFADCTEIKPQGAAQHRLRRALGLQNEFVVSYAGNLGRGHDFETVAAALSLLGRADAPVASQRLHFLFIGDGEKQASLVAAVPKALASRVHFLPPQARSELGDVLTAGDVGLITLAEGLAGLMVPSKLYALLAAGLPIVYVGPPDGRVAELCAAEPIGESVRNGDATGLVAAWLRLAQDRDRRLAMGKRARELAETRFDRPIITAQHEALLQRIVAAMAQRTRS